MILENDVYSSYSRVPGFKCRSRLTNFSSAATIPDDDEKKKEKDVTELSTEEELEEQNKAAAKIQAMHRAKKGRKKAKIIDEKNATCKRPLFHH